MTPKAPITRSQLGQAETFRITRLGRHGEVLVCTIDGCNACSPAGDIQAITKWWFGHLQKKHR